MNTKEDVICLLQEVAGGLPYPEALQQLENINFWEDDDPLTDEEQEELGRLIGLGNTSGRLDSESGMSVAWQLDWNKWKRE